MREADMFVKAESKQRFGDLKEPYANIDQMVSAEPGHGEGIVNIRMSGGEEMVVKGDAAKKLIAYLEEHSLK
jgi:hypothetical protein